MEAFSLTRIGVIGAGGISTKLSSTFRNMKNRGSDIELYAIAARDLARAEAFAAEWGYTKAYGSYEEMLADPMVDMVYIGTPHSHHAEHMKLCIQYGKPILCEKSFTGNARQAEEVLALAREKGVLVAEAIWTRYMPSREIINDLIASGSIGEPKLLTANLGYRIAHKERIAKPELAGGALLDVGVYPINFASMIFGNDVVRMESSVGMTELGVDHTENISLYYRDGKVAHLTATSLAQTDRRGVVYGDKGFLTVDNINNPQILEVYDSSFHGGKLVETIRMPEQIDGYEYEVEAFLRAMEKGLLECPEMPHEETLTIMRTMDALRAQWNMKYPFD